MSSNVIVFRYSIISEKESEIHKLRTTVFEISNEIGKMHGTVNASIQQYKRYSSTVILALPNESHLGLY